MYNEDEVKPYYVNGARVDLVSATPLLCQYCSSLSRDQYTIYAPDWYCEEKKTSVNVISVRVVIYMPTACPILEPIEVGSDVFISNFAPFHPHISASDIKLR